MEDLHKSAIPPDPGSSRRLGPMATLSKDTNEPGHPKLLLLVVAPDLRAYLREHLVAQYQVLEASRGDEGLRMVFAELPDVVVCDSMLPGLDGFGLCRELKANAATDCIYVILLTPTGDAGSRIAGLDSGADACISQPFDFAELLLRIRNFEFARKSLLRRAEEQDSMPL